MAVRLVLTGDAKRAIAEMERYQKSWKTSRKNIKETTDETSRWDRLSRQVIRRNETAQERFNRQMKETVRLYQSNRISLGQARSEVSRLDSEYKKLNRSFVSTFGRGALRNVTRLIGGYTDLMNVIRTGVQFANQYNARLAEAGQRLQTQRNPLADIIQLPNARETLAAAKRFSHEAGVTSDVGQRVAQAASARGNLGAIGGPFEELTQLGLVADPVAAINNLLGLAETAEAKPTQVLTKAIMAAVKSPVGAESLLRNVPAAAQLGLATKTPIDQSLAAVAVEATNAPSPEIAATRIESLFGEALKQGITGTIPEILTGLGSVENIGRKEATLAFLGLRKKSELFQTTLSLIETATPEIAIANIRKQARLSPELEAANLANRARRRREQAEERRGTHFELSDALINEVSTTQEEAGLPGVLITAGDALDRLERFLRGPGDYVRANRNTTGTESGDEAVRILQNIEANTGAAANSVTTLAE
jgi:hypothetical protein